MAAWNGTSNTVSRALALIELGALDHAGVDALASRLGLGERQLRRLFDQHLGASPVSVAQTRRVLLAKQLIHETRLSMMDIAMASSFGSIRRFNGVPPAMRTASSAGCAAPPDPTRPAPVWSPSCCGIGRHTTGPACWRSSRRVPSRGSRCGERRIPAGDRDRRPARHDLGAAAP